MGEHEFEPIHWHYEADRKLLENTEFMEWFAELKKQRGLEAGYGGPLEESTGIECWFTYFREEFSPREAALEDQSYWEPDQ